MSDAAAAPPGSPLAQVLFVEDSAVEMKLVNELLTRAGVQFDGHWVTTGEDALHFLHNDAGFERAPRPDIIFLDLGLPRIRGEDILQHIQGIEGLKRIPVVILSGSDFSGDVVNARDQGAIHYLVKPLTYEKLCEVVARTSRLRFKRIGEELLLQASR